MYLMTYIFQHFRKKVYNLKIVRVSFMGNHSHAKTDKAVMIATWQLERALTCDGDSRLRRRARSSSRGGAGSLILAPYDRS
jgi:hypothetical protein